MSYAAYPGIFHTGAEERYGYNSFAAIFQQQMHFGFVVHPGVVKVENGPAPVVCDVGNIRGRSETTYSLIATYLAAFAAYGHLQHSLLGNRNVLDIGIRLLLFFLCPATPILDLVCFGLVPAIPIILGLREAYQLDYFLNDQVHTTGNSRSLQFVLPQILGMHVASPDESTVSIPLSSTVARQFEVRKKEESSSVLIGQTIVLSFLTLQCLGTLVKESRRVAWTYEFEQVADGPVILADAEAFWVSLSGTFILLSSWAALLLNQQWSFYNYRSNLSDPGAIYLKLAATISSCSLCSTFGWLFLDVQHPIWQVGFFHFLMPVPYITFSNASYGGFRRFLLGKIVPLFLTGTISYGASIPLGRRGTLARKIIINGLAIASMAPILLTPLPGIRLMALGHEYSRGAFNPNQPIRRWKTWLTSAVTAGTIGLFFWPKIKQRFRFRVVSSVIQFLICYTCTAIGIITVEHVLNIISSLNLGFIIPEPSANCIKLWQDPLFYPTF